MVPQHVFDHCAETFLCSKLKKVRDFEYYFIERQTVFFYFYSLSDVTIAMSLLKCIPNFPNLSLHVIMKCSEFSKVKSDLIPETRPKKTPLNTNFSKIN